jgi:leucyl/phenylalanyl-tRNA--protein transferase
MFSRADDASKVAFLTLVEWMRGWGVELIDCQQQTEHLARFGAVAWPRATFVAAVERLMHAPTRQGRWTFDAPPAPPASGSDGSTA